MADYQQHGDNIPRAPPRNRRRSPPMKLLSPVLPAPTDAPGAMFVVDPRTLATRWLVRAGGAGRRGMANVRTTWTDRRHVLEETNTLAVRCFVWLKQSSERWFTHLFLLMALILYALLGGFIFSTIEGNHEKHENEIIQRLHEPIETMSESITDRLWQLRQRFPLPPGPNHELSSVVNEPPLPVDPFWYRRVQFHLDRFETMVTEQCRQRHNYSIERFTETDRWDFFGSVFFSMTVFTTIGYGDSPPVTTLGKTATMIYSFFGIPLLLIVLADFGKILTKTIKYLILAIRRLYYGRQLRTVRHIGRGYGPAGSNAARVQRAVLDALNRLQRHPPFYIDPSTGRVTMLPPRPETVVESSPQPPSLLTGSRNPVAPKIAVSPGTPIITPDTPMPALVPFDDLDDEFNLPVSLALFILMLYLFFGAILFWFAERWTLFQSFYFVFISMSTIGFGDFVPSHQTVLLYAFIYFLFGLTLTSMCINVIQEKLSSTFERARVTIGESFGLDPTTPITVVQPPSQSSSQSGSKRATPEPGAKPENPK